MSFLQQFKDKTILIICDVDLDGMICSLLCDYYIKPISKGYVRQNTGDRSLPDFDWEKSKQADITLFADIAPVDIDMVNKIKENSRLVICDHHESHRKLFGEMEDYYYDNTRSATKILFDLLTENLQVKKIVKQFADMANTYDMWKTEDPLWRNSKGLNNIISLYVDWKKANYQTDTQNKQGFIDAMLRKIEKSDEFYFTRKEKEKALLEEKKEKENFKKVKKEIEFRTDNQGNKYGYFECFSKLSIIASMLQKQYPDVKYFAGHGTYLETRKKEVNGKISLRCNSNFDVSVIAEKWGGGGHAESSAMELPLEDFYKFQEGKMHLI